MKQPLLSPPSPLNASSCLITCSLLIMLAYLIPYLSLYHIPHYPPPLFPGKLMRTAERHGAQPLRPSPLQSSQTSPPLLQQPRPFLMILPPRPTSTSITRSRLSARASPTGTMLAAQLLLL